jgi:phosphoribosylaminoimidazole carboxylase PurE protein
MTVESNRDDARVVILMGSKSDLPHAEAIAKALREFGIGCAMRVASAHKVTSYLLELLAAYDAADAPRVFITIAGRSNALSGVVDANVRWPVIACPPSSDRYGGMDILSSLRMPSGVAPLVILEPAAAALAAAKMLALADPTMAERVARFQAEQQERAIANDRDLASGDA